MYNLGLQAFLPVLGLTCEEHLQPCLVVLCRSFGALAAAALLLGKSYSDTMLNHKGYG